MRLPRNWRTGPAADRLRAQRFIYADIGARGGVPKRWEVMAPLLEVIAFEAEPAEARRLSETIRRTGAVARVVPAAAWHSSGRAMLHVTRNPGCSSLLPPRSGFLSEFPDSHRFDIVSSEDVETVTLDAAMRNLGHRTCGFLKIDAQGGALDVLRGSETALDGALGVEIEVELTPMYEGEALFGDTDAWLRAAGFELVDLRPTYWRREAARGVGGTRGQLIFCDALYARAPRQFSARLAAADERGAEHLCASALLMCDVYGMDDWAVAYGAIAGDAPGAAWLRARPATRGGRLPLPRVRAQVGLWLKDLGDALIESPEIWGVAEQRLGGGSRLGPQFVSRALGKLVGRRRGLNR